MAFINWFPSLSSLCSGLCDDSCEVNSHLKYFQMENRDNLLNVHQSFILSLFSKVSSEASCIHKLNTGYFTEHRETLTIWLCWSHHHKAVLCSNIFLLSLQILPVSSQVRSVRSDPQGDPDRLPLHEPGQGQEEQAGGDGRVVSGPQPQQLLHQFSQLGGLLRERTTEPSWTGKTDRDATFKGIVPQFETWIIKLSLRVRRKDRGWSSRLTLDLKKNMSQTYSFKLSK